MSFIISIDILNFIYVIIILSFIITILQFGAMVGTALSDKYLFYKNKQLEREIKELKEELEE